MHKVTKKTRFFQINYLEEDRTINQLFRSIKKAEDRYFKIFRIKPKEYKIIVAYTREEFDKYVGYKTEPWVQGLVVKGKLIMFSPSVRDQLVVTKLPKHLDFDTFFDHEINHFFYISYVGSYRPLWLSEGYATYMMNPGMIDFFRSDQEIKKLENPERYLFYRLVKEKFSKFNGQMYAFGTLLVGYLIEKFGEEKILDLINSYKANPNKSAFEKKFKNLYNLSIIEALKKAIMY